MILVVVAFNVFVLFAIVVARNRLVSPTDDIIDFVVVVVVVVLAEDDGDPGDGDVGVGVRNISLSLFSDWTYPRCSR